LYLHFLIHLLLRARPWFPVNTKQIWLWQRDFPLIPVSKQHSIFTIKSVSDWYVVRPEKEKTTRCSIGPISICTSSVQTRKSPGKIKSLKDYRRPTTHLISTHNLYLYLYLYLYLIIKKKAFPWFGPFDLIVRPFGPCNVFDRSLTLFGLTRTSPLQCVSFLFPGLQIEPYPDRKYPDRSGSLYSCLL
jgi:hypothetical protein